MKKTRILLVEDDRDHVEFIKRSFDKEKDEFTIETTDSIKEAKRIINREIPDVIIADFVLSDGKGTDLLLGEKGSGFLNFDEEVIPYPLIILTGQGSEKIAVDSLKSGASDYVIKSVANFASLPQITRRAIRDWKNVSERRKIEKLLILKNRELNSFAHRVSNDIKNPVNLIKGYLAAIQQDPSLFDKYLPKVISQSDNIINYVNNMLMLSKSHKVLAMNETINPEAIIKGIFLSFKTGGINSRLIISDKLPEIKGDQSGIRLIFSNLIGNCFKYRDPEKDILTVEVKVKTEKGKAVFSIKDNGMGIAKEDLKKLFMPEYTLVKNRKTTFGLPIVKKIVEAHGGKVSVKSEGLGKGAVFTFDLPADK